MDTPRRRSLIEKILHHHTSQPSPLSHETQSTTGLITPTNAPSDTRTIALPLTGGGTETLLIPNDQMPADPANADPGHWNFHHGTRKASVAASDTGEKTVHASDVEKAHFLSLMEQTKGMSEGQVKEFLKNRGVVDGGKLMRNFEGGHGKSGGGYMQVVGPDRGAM